jgi:hypothetical protein
MYSHKHVKTGVKKLETLLEPKWWLTTVDMENLIANMWELQGSQQMVMTDITAITTGQEGTKVNQKKMSTKKQCTPFKKG